MSDTTIYAAWSPGEVRVAAVTNGALADYALWRPGSPDGVGDLYLGRVTAIVPAMAGAFVELAPNVAEGFLPDSEGAKGLTEGAIITVRITRAALGGKGPRLSARGGEVGEQTAPAPAGLVRRGVDPLRELAARFQEARVVVDDPALAATLRADLGERIDRVQDAFDDAIETEVESLAASQVALDSGLRLSVHPTPALVAIDVDAGAALVRGVKPGRTGHIEGDNPAARRHRELNAAALPELARQIRLRNLSGAILVDLAGLKAKQRTSFAAGLAEALARDPLKPRFLGFTALGLAEIVRPRVRAPLHEMLSGPLASGLAALRAIARATRASPGQRLILHAGPAVIGALETDAQALTDLARITGQRLNSRSDPSLAGNGWHIEAVHG